MYDYQHLSLYKAEHDIVWLALNVQGKPANILMPEVLDEIQIACSEVKHLAASGLVICSAKSNGFIAGADIERFRGDKEATSNIELAKEYIGQGQHTCNVVEALEIPTVAMIDGFCMGGGTELSLACDYIVVTDSAKTRISLPEIKLGIHPGFGGTVRSIKRMGILKAMPMMLTGKAYTGRIAKKLGLADFCVPIRQLKSTAEHVILNKPAKKAVPAHIRLLEKKPMRSVVAAQMRKQVAQKANPEHYPAPFALIDLWKEHGGNEADMYEHEALSVSKLILTETAQNLVRVFFLQSQLKGLGDKSLINPKHIHVIGGGVMGGDIATWCAAQGLKVTVQDMSDEALAKVIQRANKTLQRKFKKDQISIRDALDRLIPDKEGHGISSADVIIEAIFEDLDVKRQVFKHVEEKARPDAILATNTSSIPLADIAEALQKPERLIGLHFFNPVFRMPLLEVVYDENVTSNEQIAMGTALGRHINKLPLPVKSSPGFLINRILMPYLLEGVTLHQQGVPVTVIDKAAKDFGMPMGPLELADTVGLDICLHVGKILSSALGTELPDNLQTYIDDKKLGKKAGEGFYLYKKGKLVKPKDSQWEGDTQQLQEKLISKMLDESEKCLDERVVENADLLDAGVIFGTGFAPFRGGPMNYLKSK